MVSDPTYPSINYDDFPKHDWMKQYGEVNEVIATNAPTTKGKGFNTITYVDANLAGDKVT